MSSSMPTKPVNITKYLDKKRQLGSAKRPVRPRPGVDVPRPMTGEPHMQNQFLETRAELASGTAGQNTWVEHVGGTHLLYEDEFGVQTMERPPPGQQGEWSFQRAGDVLSDASRQLLIRDLRALRRSTPINENTNLIGVGRPVWEDANEMLYEAGV